MKANELRVGNWVNIGYNKQWEHDDFANYFGGSKGLDNDQVQPIDPTPEILEKAGFSKDDYYGGNVFSLKISHNHEIMWDDGLFTLECDDSFYNERLNHIKHLHQLQNFYFAWTGKELEIELL